MNSILIVKQGAAGDVVRTTTLLHLFRDSHVDWLVHPANKELLPAHRLRTTFTTPRDLPRAVPYDLVISLEDDAAFLSEVFANLTARQIFGSYVAMEAGVAYTEDSRPWFDMSLVSRFGLARANELKLVNRRSYQEILFGCLGKQFTGEQYILPATENLSDLRGDVATASKAGARWPLKSWPGFAELTAQCSTRYVMNELPHRSDLIRHLADVRGHRVLVSNDSLPMHLALGLGIPTVGLFTCTSPWEIYGYGLLTSIVSPLLEKYFYSREDAEEAKAAIPVAQVVRELDAIMRSLPRGSLRAGANPGGRL